MIVSVTCPHNVRYGLTTILSGGTIDVPAYVARSIAALEGASADLPAGDIAADLAALEEADAYEANFILEAFGVPLLARSEREPTADNPGGLPLMTAAEKIAKAREVFTERGEPSVAWER